MKILVFKRLKSPGFPEDYEQTQIKCKYNSHLEAQQINKSESNY